MFKDIETGTLVLLCRSVDTVPSVTLQLLPGSSRIVPVRFGAFPVLDPYVGVGQERIMLSALFHSRRPLCSYHDQVIEVTLG